jgi:hypothetical protein
VILENAVLGGYAANSKQERTDFESYLVCIQLTAAQNVSLNLGSSFYLGVTRD